MLSGAKAGSASRLGWSRNMARPDGEAQTRRQRLRDRVKMHIRSVFSRNKKPIQQNPSVQDLTTLEVEPVGNTKCDLPDKEVKEDGFPVTASQDVLNAHDESYAGPISTYNSMCKEEAEKILPESKEVTRSIVGNSCKSEVYSLYNDQIRDGALVEVPNSSVLGHNAMKFSLHDPIDLHGFATKDHRDNTRHPNLGKVIHYHTNSLGVPKTIQSGDAKNNNDTECSQMFGKNKTDYNGACTDSALQKTAPIEIMTDTQRNPHYTYYAPYVSRATRKDKLEALASDKIKERTRARLFSESTLVNSTRATLPCLNQTVFVTGPKLDVEGDATVTDEALEKPKTLRIDRAELNGIGHINDQDSVLAQTKTKKSCHKVEDKGIQLRQPLWAAVNSNEQYQIKDEQIERLTSINQALRFQYEEQQAAHSTKFEELNRMHGEKEQQIVLLREQIDVITCVANRETEQHLENAAFLANNVSFLQQEVARLLAEQRSRYVRTPLATSYEPPTMDDPETTKVIEHAFMLRTELEEVKKAKTALEDERTNLQQEARVAIHTNKEFAEQAEVTHNLSKAYDRLERKSNVEKKVSEEQLEFYREENKRLRDCNVELTAEMEQYKDYNAYILQTLKRRLVRDDVLQAIEDYYNVGQADIEFLIEKVQQQDLEILTLRKIATKSKIDLINIEAGLSEELRQVHKKLKVTEKGQKSLEVEKLGFEMELQVLQKDQRDTLKAKNDEISCLRSQLQKLVEWKEAMLLGNVDDLVQMQLKHKDAEISQLKRKVKDLQQNLATWYEYGARQERNHELECGAALRHGAEEDRYQSRIVKLGFEMEELERQLAEYEEIKYRDRKSLMTDLIITRQKVTDLSKKLESKSTASAEVIAQLRSLGRSLVQRMNTLERALRGKGLLVQETEGLSLAELWQLCKAHLGLELTANEDCPHEPGFEAASAKDLEEGMPTPCANFNGSVVYVSSSESSDAGDEENTIIFQQQDVSRQSQPAIFSASPAQANSEMVHPHWVAEKARKQRFLCGELVVDGEDDVRSTQAWLSDSPPKYTGKGKGRVFSMP